MHLLPLLNVAISCCLLKFCFTAGLCLVLKVPPFVLQASVLSSFGKLLQWSLENDEVAAGHTSSLAAAVLLLASEAQQVTKTSPSKQPVTIAISPNLNV